MGMLAAAIACGTAPFGVAVAQWMSRRSYRRITDHHRLNRSAWWLALAIPVVAATWKTLL